MGQSLQALTWWTIVATLIVIATNPLIIVLYLLLSVLVYVISLYAHPMRSCWTCNGGGRHRGRLFNYATRPCDTCDGSGRRLRLGCTLLHIDENGRRRP